jgi:hypothetical protein
MCLPGAGLLFPLVAALSISLAPECVARCAAMEECHIEIIIQFDLFIDTPEI